MAGIDGEENKSASLAMEELNQLVVTITSPGGVAAQISSPSKKTRGERFGLSGWGQLVSFDEVSIKDAHHPEQITDSEERHALRSAPKNPDADALTSLSLVLLNTNEFLYTE